MSDKIRLGISSCLLGEMVRYDGGHQLDRYMRDTLSTYVEWVPVCPEVEVGMGVDGVGEVGLNLPLSFHSSVLGSSIFVVI